MKKVFLLIIVLVLFLPGLSFSQSVIAADGGRSHSDGITIDWTLGEFAVATLNTPAGILTEGFHQPFLNAELVPPGSPRENTSQYTLDYDISLAPNPVKQLLQVKIQHKEAIPVTMRLIHPSGRLLLQREINSPAQFEINFNSYPKGLYLIQLFETKGLPIQTYKVTKF